MMWYEYIVRWFDEYDSLERVNSGVTYAENMVEAMANIASYYGRDTLFSVRIHELDDFTCFDFKDYKEDGSINRFFEAINVEPKVQV